MKGVKSKKKIRDINTQSQLPTAQHYEREDFPAEITGARKIKKKLRKNKKEAMASDVKAENREEHAKYDHSNSVGTSKKKKKRRITLEKKPIIKEADEISLAKRLKRKKKQTSPELERSAESIEIEGDSGEIRGSLKRNKSRNKMGKESEAEKSKFEMGKESETEKSKFEMGKETETQVDVHEFGDYGTINKCLGGKGGEFEKKKSNKSMKKKRKKLTSMESKWNQNKNNAEAVILESEDVQGTKKKKRLDARSAEFVANLVPDVVEEISAVDEDNSKGMKKWLNEYWNSRPGLTVLQQRIDDFILSHEAQEEQARKEREALAAEEGWTVVSCHKGKKKSTDPETGLSVGSVASAAVMDSAAKKKKEIPLDFYRFQRREAQRKEVMTLQSKFEQDKKRIQQVRAARKFRPY